MTISRTTSVLFLTATPPASDNNFKNNVLADNLNRLGAHVDFRSILDSSLGSNEVAKYSHVLFLNCWDYHRYFPVFTHFVRETLVSAKSQNPNLRVLNDPDLVLWNSNKIYLQELSLKGFTIPSTIYLNPGTAPNLIKQHLLFRPSSLPVVIKPSISASSFCTQKIQNPHQLTAKEEDFIHEISSAKDIGFIMIQDFLPNITSGEYSLIFIKGDLMHVVRKVPAEGDFRTASNSGARFELLDKNQVEKDALEVGNKLFGYLKEKGNGDNILYLRCDGVIDISGKFVLMEAECIEPYLWLNQTGGGSEALHRLCDFIFQGQ